MGDGELKKCGPIEVMQSSVGSLAREIAKKLICEDVLIGGLGKSMSFLGISVREVDLPSF